ncbi:MAG: hypothetical protein AAB460_02560 [Patescibacteria group bacterium]
MKKLSLISLLVLTLALVFIPARATFAEDANTDTEKTRREMMREGVTERREMWKENQEERKAFWTEKREEFRGKLEKIRAERIDGWVRTMGARFDNAIEFLNNIADRIEARIETIEDETGETLTDAWTHLDAAREHIAEASEAVEKIPAAVEAALDSETPKEAFAPVRTLFGEAKTHIQEAHAELRAAVASIKEIRKNDTGQNEN